MALIPHAGGVKGRSDTGKERIQGQVVIADAVRVKGRSDTRKTESRVRCLLHM